jgi:hypothetical protein
VYAFSVAVVAGQRERVALRGARAIVKLLGVTTELKPGRSTDAVYVSLAEPTLFTVRVTVCAPARSPIAIEAWFRLLASMAGTALPIRP